jgi:ketosteroid isomerase-like protein
MIAKRTNPGTAIQGLIAAVGTLLLLTGGLAAQQRGEEEAPQHRTTTEQVAEGDTDGQEAEITAVIEAVFAATEARNFAALDTLYTQNATIVEGAGIDRGWANYRDHHLKPELAKFENFTYRPRNIEPHVGEDWAWAHFEYDLKLRIEGRDVDRVGRGTVVLEPRNGSWAVRHMQTANRPRE